MQSGVPPEQKPLAACLHRLSDTRVRCHICGDPVLFPGCSVLALTFRSIVTESPRKAVRQFRTVDVPDVWLTIQDCGCPRCFQMFQMFGGCPRCCGLRRLSNTRVRCHIFWRPHFVLGLFCFSADFQVDSDRTSAESSRMVEDRGCPRLLPGPGPGAASSARLTPSRGRGQPRPAASRPGYGHAVAEVGRDNREFVVNFQRRCNRLCRQCTRRPLQTACFSAASTVP